MAPKQFSRQHVVDLLRRAGWSDLADEVSKTMPDPIDVKQLAAWGMQHGVSFNDLISRFGSSI